MKMVAVTYNDITHWDNISLTENHEMLQFTIYGELVNELPDRYIVASEVCSDASDEQSAVYVIPRGCVTKIVELVGRED